MAESGASNTVPVLLEGRGRWPGDAPSAADARGFAERVGSALVGATTPRGPRPAVVVVTANERTLLSVRTQGSHFELRVSWRLVGHEQAVVAATERWMRTGTLGSEIDDLIASLPSPRAAAEPTAAPARAAGDHVDLRAVLSAVAPLAEAVPLAATLQIGWSTRRRAKRSLRLGSADPGRGVIRIHPSLDAPSVPEYVVQMVVYHELCHCVAPPLSRYQARSRGEAHRIHHEAFRALEARFPQLEQANQWVRDNFRGLLQY